LALKNLALGHGIGNGVKIEKFITFSFIAIFSKCVKNTIKSDGLSWLRSSDKDLKFWKYVSNFRKYRSSSIQLEVRGAHFVEPSAVADVFAKHFQSVYNNHCPMDISSL
jgi:hypothetical protein